MDKRAWIKTSSCFIGDQKKPQIIYKLKNGCLGSITLEVDIPTVQPQLQKTLYKM